MDINEIVEEFLMNVEQSLSSQDNKKQIKKLSAEISKTEVKISKLVDLHQDGYRILPLCCELRRGSRRRTPLVPFIFARK